MADINDKSFRQALIERFLDCDTTVAEERELARFYADCREKGQVPEGEGSICELVTVTVAAGGDAEPHEPMVKRRIHWRWAAAACAAVAIAVGAAVEFATSGNESPVLATNRNAAVASHEDEELQTEENGIQPAANDSVADSSVGRRVAQPSVRMACRQPKSPRPVVSEAEAAKNEVSSAVDMSDVCDMAVEAFRDADGITIERKGDFVLLTTANGDGTCRRYVVGEASDGQMTLAEL